SLLEEIGVLEQHSQGVQALQYAPRRFGEKRALRHGAEVVDVVKDVEEENDVRPVDEHGLEHPDLLQGVAVGTARVYHLPRGSRGAGELSAEQLPETVLGAGDADAEGEGVPDQEQAAGPRGALARVFGVAEP